MRAAILILRKDLLQRVRDRTVWIVGVIAPLSLAAVLGVVVGGFGPGALPPPSWGVVDEDQGVLGGSLVDDVLPAVAVSLGGTITRFPSVEAGEEAVAEGDLTALFIVPRGLTDQLLVGGQTVPAVEVVGRVGRDLENAIASAVAGAWADEVAITQRAVASAVAGGALSVEDALLAGPALRAPDLLQLTPLSGADRTLDGATYVAAGMGVFFLFFTVGLGVIGLLEESAEGTLARLHASPNPRWSVVVGKVLTSIAIGFMSTVLLVVATTVFLGASWGPPLAVVVLVAAAVLAAVSLVSVVAAFAESADSANSVQAVIGIVLGMLGGAFFPVATEPGALATASDLTPHGMFLTAVGDLQVPGAGIVEIAPQLLGLLAFALVVAAAGGAVGRLREVR